MMKRPDEIVCKDLNGNRLHIGDRVYCAPRSYGGPGDVCCTTPVFDGEGEEVKKASVRGRISQILWSERHGRPIIEIMTPKAGAAVLYPELVKIQAGRTKAEKESALHARRADKLKEIRRKEREEGKIKDVPDLVVKPKKRKRKKTKPANRKRG